MSAGSWTEFGASFLIRTCAHGSGGRRLDQANLEPSMLAGAVADGADRRYAGVRVPVAGASLGGDQAAAAARPAPVLAVHDRSCAWGFPPGGLHPIGADHRPERELSRAWPKACRVSWTADTPSLTRGPSDCGWFRQVRRRLLPRRVRVRRRTLRACALCRRPA